MKVIWTETALTHLGKIYDFIARDSPRYASRMMDRITARTKQLSTFAESANVVPEYQDQAIREVIEGSYRIIYRVKSDRVEVLSVIHGAQTLPSQLPT